MLEVLFKDWNASNTLAVFASILGFGSVVFGIVSYNRQQKWQTHLHLVDRLDRMLSAGPAKVALLAIDWVKRPIALDEHGEKLVGSATLELSKDKVKRSLVVDFKESRDLEVLYLRDCFESLGDHLAIYSSMAKNGLVRHDELAPYFSHYARRLLSTDGVNSSEVQDEFWEFMDRFYPNAGLRNFLKTILDKSK